jgi:flagellar hook-associated protein 3 FlgL
MTISTAFLFQRSVSQMGDLQTRIADAQNQLASGKQVTKPSDQPDQAASIQRLQSAIARQDSYLKTINTVNDRLAAEEPVVQNSSNAMTRIKELMVQAANDTLNAKDRGAIAIELQGLRDDLLSAANTRDLNGNYLFSGTRVGNTAFGKSSVEGAGYVGDTSVNYVDIGDQRTIQLNQLGSSIFKGVTRATPDGPQQVGFFQALDDAIGAVKNSDRHGMEKSLDEVSVLSDSLSQALAQIGSDMNVLDAQKTSIETAQIQLKTTLSNTQDVDYATAISKLKQDMMGLEAAQSSFAQTSGLNLFNFIK